MTSDNQDFNLENLEQLAEEGKSLLGDHELLNQITEDSLKEIDQKLKQKPFLEKFWKKILFCIIIFGLALLLLKNLGDSRQNELLAYYQAPPFLLDQTQRSVQSKVNDFDRIKQLYANEEYAECLSAIKYQLSLPEINTDLNVYQGICEFQLQEYSSAINTLSKPVDKLEDLRQWNLAMALIANKEFAKAKTLLQELQKLPDFYKKQKVKELLKKI